MFRNGYGLSVYASGEITARFLQEFGLIKGRQKGTISQPFGVSRKGRNKIRRAINGCLASRVRVEQPSPAPVFITLTTQQQLSDLAFKRKCADWIKRGKNLHPMFCDYVVCYELHQSGQMHSHVLMFEPMPRVVFQSQRDLWADYYGMGVWSCDISSVRELAETAGRYLSKVPEYMSKDESGLPRPIRGRTYTISSSLQAYTKPVTEPITLSVSSSELSELSDYATYTDDNYFRINSTKSLQDATELLTFVGIPYELKAGWDDKH